MSEQKKSTGITFIEALTVLFIGLKLTGYIDWSWYLVLGFLWIPLCIIWFIWSLVVLIDGLTRFWRN